MHLARDSLEIDVVVGENAREALGYPTAGNRRQMGWGSSRSPTLDLTRWVDPYPFALPITPFTSQLIA